MNKRRLLKLAEFLDTVPPEKFDMSNWARADEPVTDKPRCATAACALGWATAIPEFNRAGLVLELVCKGARDAIVTYSGVTGEYAGAAFFGLTYEQADDLFMSGFNMTPKGKAAQIRRMVKEAA